MTHPPAYWIEMASPANAMGERVDLRWYHQATACINRTSHAHKDPEGAQRLQRHVKLMTHCENMQFEKIIKMDSEELAASVGAIQKALVKWTPRALFSFLYNAVYSLHRRLDQGFTKELCEEFLKATLPWGESDAFHLNQPRLLDLAGVIPDKCQVFWIEKWYSDFMRSIFAKYQSTKDEDLLRLSAAAGLLAWDLPEESDAIAPLLVNTCAEMQVIFRVLRLLSQPHLALDTTSPDDAFHDVGAMEQAAHSTSSDAFINRIGRLILESEALSARLAAFGECKDSWRKHSGGLQAQVDALKSVDVHAASPESVIEMVKAALKFKAKYQHNLPPGTFATFDAKVADVMGSFVSAAVGEEGLEPATMNDIQNVLADFQSAYPTHTDADAWTEKVAERMRGASARGRVAFIKAAVEQMTKEVCNEDSSKRFRQEVSQLRDLPTEQEAMLDACVASLLSATADMVPAKVGQPLPELFKQCAMAIECMMSGLPKGPLQQRTADAWATFKSADGVLQALQSSSLVPADAGSEQPPATMADLLTLSRALAQAASAGKTHTIENVKALHEAAESHLRAAAAAACQQEVVKLQKASKDVTDLLYSVGALSEGSFAEKHIAITQWPEYLKLAQETIMNLDEKQFKESLKALDESLSTLADFHHKLRCEKTWAEHADMSREAWQVVFVRELVDAYSQDLSSATAKASAREATNAVIAAAFTRGINKADFAAAMQARMSSARKLKLA